MGNEVNMFSAPLSEEEQIELSNVLDHFFQLYQNGFADQIVEDGADETSDNLCDELKDLYELVNQLIDRAIE